MMMITHEQEEDIRGRKEVVNRSTDMKLRTHDRVIMNYSHTRSGNIFRIN